MALVSVSDDKIQITILILRRGALSKQHPLSTSHPTMEVQKAYFDRSVQCKSVFYTLHRTIFYIWMCIVMYLCLIHSMAEELHHYIWLHPIAPLLFHSLRTSFLADQKQSKEEATKLEQGEVGTSWTKLDQGQDVSQPLQKTGIRMCMWVKGRYCKTWENEIISFLSQHCWHKAKALSTIVCHSWKNGQTQQTRLCYSQVGRANFLLLCV